MRYLFSSLQLSLPFLYFGSINWPSTNYPYFFHNSNSSLMLDQDRPSPFFSICFYVVVDIAFWVFVTLYLLGDVDHQDNFLKYTRAFPAMLIIIELFTLRITHRGMWAVLLAYLSYSIGDWLFIFRNQEDPYVAGIIAFIIAHGLVLASIVVFVRAVAAQEGGLKKIMGSYTAFTAILIIILAATIISFIFLATNVAPQFGGYVLVIVGLLCVAMIGMVMSGFFYFFACHKISSELYWGSLETMFGTLLIYGSNHLLFHGKYNQIYMDRISGAANAYPEMLGYYFGLYFMGKGFFNTARYFSLLDSKEVGPNLRYKVGRGARSGSDSKIDSNPARDSVEKKQKGEGEEESNPERKQERFGSNVRLEN